MLGPPSQSSKRNCRELSFGHSYYRFTCNFGLQSWYTSLGYTSLGTKQNSAWWCNGSTLTLTTYRERLRFKPWLGNSWSQRKHFRLQRLSECVFSSLARAILWGMAHCYRPTQELSYDLQDLGLTLKLNPESWRIQGRCCSRARMYSAWSLVLWWVSKNDYWHHLRNNAEPAFWGRYMPWWASGTVDDIGILLFLRVKS